LKRFDPPKLSGGLPSLIAGLKFGWMPFDRGWKPLPHINDEWVGAASSRDISGIRIQIGRKLKMTEETKQEFWRWTESNWVNPDVKWQDAQFITVGIDVGSVSSQAVIVADGKIYAYSNMRTGFDGPNSARNALKFALEVADELPEDRMDYCIGTGYGRVNVPFADRTLTEIACHARGAKFIYGPKVRTVLDVGGQDIKAIRCDKKGKVTNFLMNDKCAAGTGRGMEVFSDLLGVPINNVGDRSFEFKGEEPPAISSTCVVYAKSEATGLLRKGLSIEEVLAAYCKAMAEQIFSLVERVGIKPEFAVTGGMAKNRGVMDRLMPKVGLERLTTEWDTQIAGAAGAALFGLKLCQKGKAKKK
jgi:bzd-type benzoyl-CoA reductase Q subunit